MVEVEMKKRGDGERTHQHQAWKREHDTTHSMGTQHHQVKQSYPLPKSPEPFQPPGIQAKVYQAKELDE